MEIAVGKDIQSICGKCGDVWHVIVDLRGDKIGKVQCKQCGGYHRYKASPGDVPAKAPAKKRTTVKATDGKPAKKATKKKSAKKSARATEAHPNAPSVDPNLELPVRDYAMKDTYQTGERIEHPTFGQGVVESFPTPQKMNVFFEDGRRTLAQGRSASPSH